MATMETALAVVKDVTTEFRTRTVAEKVPAAVGVQVITPVVGLIVIPAGAPASRLNVSGLAGTLGSVAPTVKVRVWPRVTVLIPRVDSESTGARLGLTLRRWLVS